MQTHAAALDVQMSKAGRKSLASSKLVKRMEVKSGMVSSLVNKGLPQSEQKLRVVSAPLEARTVWFFGAPVTLMDLVATTTPEANGAPLDC